MAQTQKKIKPQKSVRRKATKRGTSSAQADFQEASLKVEPLPESPYTQKPKKKRKASKKKAQGAEGSRKPKASKRKANSECVRQPRPLKTRIKLWILGILSAIVFVLITIFILSFTSVFQVTSVQFAPTEHITQEDIARLIELPDNANLLNVSAGKIEGSLKKNPWVASISMYREFPHTLRIEVHEKKIRALVVLSMSSTVWALSEQNTWIEPIPMESPSESLSQTAITAAMSLGAVVIDNAPNTVAPKTGATLEDENVKAAITYQTTFTRDLSEQVIEYNVQTLESLSCELKSGVEILLGEPKDIMVKERVIEELINKYPNQLTSINVRMPDKPSYRKIADGTYNSGTGVQGG